MVIDIFYNYIYIPSKSCKVFALLYKARTAENSYNSWNLAADFTVASLPELAVSPDNVDEFMQTSKMMKLTFTSSKIFSSVSLNLLLPSMQHLTSMHWPKY